MTKYPDNFNYKYIFDLRYFSWSRIPVCVFNNFTEDNISTIYQYANISMYN